MHTFHQIFITHEPNEQYRKAYNNVFKMKSPNIWYDLMVILPRGNPAQAKLEEE